MERIRRIGFALGLALLVAAPAWAERVIVKCSRPCAEAIAAVERGGGTVTHRYRYVDAIAADVPARTLAAVRTVVGPGAVRKDLLVELPTAARDRDGSRSLFDTDADGVEALDEAAVAALAEASPQAYLINNAFMNLGPVHAAGYTGAGTKVAVIDSGIRPGFPHLTLDGSVIGGEDFVGDALGWSNFANGGHGTFVAGMISANVLFNFAATSTLARSVATHCPSCVSASTATLTQIPMIGAAPLSSIYALRVFGPTGGAPTSRIIAAMERVLELRERFDAGHPETMNADGSYTALNVAVCNMSLGGPTLYAGRDIEDELTNAFLDRDIVLVTSAGNAGPSGSTGGSPGTGFGSLTVGASSSPVHERVLRDLQFGLGIGALYRPFGGIQTADFSSRGPTADGRIDPEIVANGYASYGQGFAGTTSGITIGSGTSFSAPSVAGVAAVLRQAFPAASARQIRNALILSANPAMIADGSGPLDRGAGHVDAAAAWGLLEAGTVPDTPGLEGGVNTNVKVNLLQGAQVPTFDGNVTRTATSLLPGQRLDTYYRVLPNTAAVIVTLSGVTPGPVQNVFFGDDILLTVHSAKTSSIGEGDYDLYAFTTGGVWMFPNPEQGMMRVTLNGDWTNASPIDATVNVYSVASPFPQTTAQSRIRDGELLAYPFTVPVGASSLQVRLEWDADWGAYPANDLDVILIAPGGGVVSTGATLDAPEFFEIADPAPGDWQALVDGFSVSSKNGDRFKLRIAIDGRVVR